MARAKFTFVDINEFYDKDELKKNEFSTDLVVLTDSERFLVNNMFDHLKTISPETLDVFANRIADLERLTQNIAHFPSLLKNQSQLGAMQDQKNLVESLLSQKGSDKSLHLPSKAILGKGFLVAKFNVFISMSKIAVEYRFKHSEIAAYRKAALQLMFTIMAEDVYLSLLDNTDIPRDLREQIASELIILWEHRCDENVEYIAPVLKNVWLARRKIAPVFGTMMGTSELIQLSMEMDENWCKFISSKMSDPEVSMAMEEFLFGISYEDIVRLKQTLKDKGISAIGRQEVYSILEKDPEPDSSETETLADPRQFFLNYAERRDNAKARLRMKLNGPHYTLEDHFMRFILAKNKEKQYNDVYAK